MSKYWGISLIEILIALFIGSIIIFFSVNSIADYFTHRKQDVYMQQLYHDLKWARTEAVALNIPVAIQPYHDDKVATDWCQGWAVYKNPQGNGLQDSTQILKIRAASESACHIVFSSSLGFDSFQFQPQGNSNYQNGHFYFYNGEKLIKKIIINQVGRVRWE